MCVIVYEKAGKRAPKKTLKLCFEANKDGVGIAYTDNGKLIIHKGLFSFKEYWNLRRDLSGPIVSHFRIATHGKVSAETCHPFEVSPNMVVFHNGTLHSFVPNEKGGDLTDTQVFIQRVLSGLPASFHKNDGILRLIANAISPSKFVLMTSEGEVITINPHLGETINGVWYSNTRWKPHVVTQAVGAKNRALAVYRDSSYAYAESCVSCGKKLDVGDDLFYCKECLKDWEIINV